MGDRRAALILLLILCFAVVSFSQIGIVKAQDTIYINADGSVEGTDKIQRDENVYTLTDNIDRRLIMVLKDGIVIDGAGYALRGGLPSGIQLAYRDNVTIKNFIISLEKFTGDCIWVYYCSNCIILNNTMQSDYWCSGIDVWGGGSNFIAGNRIMNTTCGIFLGEGTSNNIIFGNTITGNTHSIDIVKSQNNTVYRNNFINNNYISIMTHTSTTSFVNHLDNGTTGNYWNDYNGTDSNGDGIGDTPHVINENIQDNYPLVNPVDIAGIPEFPSWVILPLFIVATMVVIIVRNKLSRKGLT